MIFIWVNRKFALMNLIILIIAGPLILSSYKINSSSLEQQSAISLLSFNARLFRKHHTYSQFSIESIKWLAKDTAQIICIQEYSTNDNWDVLDVTGKMDARGFEKNIYTADRIDSDHSPGMAIFSIYPIVNSGYIWQGDSSMNAGMFSDLKINDDTLRIYNVHLTSMNLSLSRLKNSNNYLTATIDILYKLKIGALSRDNQVNKLIDHVKQSPHAAIVCGDFNETPYSNNYLKMKSFLNNTFESSGRGFGFTLNKSLSFFRIDHQFYTKDITPLHYEVDKSMRISDHFPTRGFYQLSSQ